MGRKIVICLPIQLVTRADLDFIHAVKNVELGERDAGNAAYRRRLAHKHGVEPAAAPLTSGIHAKFATAWAQQLANIVVLLGRERARANAGGIGFKDALPENYPQGAQANRKI